MVSLISRACLSWSRSYWPRHFALFLSSVWLVVGGFGCAPKDTKLGGNSGSDAPKYFFNSGNYSMDQAEYLSLRLVDTLNKVASGLTQASGEAVAGRSIFQTDEKSAKKLRGACSKEWARFTRRDATELVIDLRSDNCDLAQRMGLSAGKVDAAGVFGLAALQPQNEDGDDRDRDRGVPESGSSDNAGANNAADDAGVAQLVPGSLLANGYERLVLRKAAGGGIENVTYETLGPQEIIGLTKGRRKGEFRLLEERWVEAQLFKGDFQELPGQGQVFRVVATYRVSEEQNFDWSTRRIRSGGDHLIKMTFYARWAGAAWTGVVVASVAYDRRVTGDIESKGRGRSKQTSLAKLDEVYKVDLGYQPVDGKDKGRPFEISETNCQIPVGALVVGDEVGSRKQDKLSQKNSRQLEYGRVGIFSTALKQLRPWSHCQPERRIKLPTGGEKVIPASTKIQFGPDELPTLVPVWRIFWR